MDTTLANDVKNKAVELIRKSGFPVSEAEWQNLQVNDFGLGRLREEGFAFIDILRTARLRITLLVLLPNQTLPQHLHPAYENEPGKEETLRVIYGATKVYIKGEQSNSEITIPFGKDTYYTARKKIALVAGLQYTVPPTVEHWFQGGPEGSVNICFQNRVDETKNLFYDPKSSGCPIKPTDK